MPRPSWTEETFWNKVKCGAKNECWEWQGYLNSGKRSYENRYGRVDIFGNKGVYVHRVAYYLSNPNAIELNRGSGLFVLHKCDNSKCCNPNHLFLGTHQDNMDDKCNKERQARYRSVESPRAKLTEQDVKDIRNMRMKGASTKSLMAKYKVSKSAIQHLLTNRTYKDI